MRFTLAIKLEDEVQHGNTLIGRATTSVDLELSNHFENDTDATELITYFVMHSFDSLLDKTLKGLHQERARVLEDHLVKLSEQAQAAAEAEQAKAAEAKKTAPVEPAAAEPKTEVKDAKPKPAQEAPKVQEVR